MTKSEIVGLAERLRLLLAKLRDSQSVPSGDLVEVSSDALCDVLNKAGDAVDLAEFCESVLADTRTLSISLDQEGLVEKVAQAIFDEHHYAHEAAETGHLPSQHSDDQERARRMARAALLAIRQE